MPEGATIIRFRNILSSVVGGNRQSDLRPAYACSRANALCRARTASGSRDSSIRQVMRISLVALLSEQLLR
jgi:hypothetical protein